MHTVQLIRSLMTGTLAIAVSVPCAAAGQGELIGRVVDMSGAALPGVAVTLESPALAEPFVTITDGVGTYHVTHVPEGRYRVQFDLDGFGPVEVLDVVITPDQRVRLDRALELAGLREVVEVVGQAPPEPPPPPPPARRVVADLQLLPVHAAASVCGPGEVAHDGPPLALIAPHADGGRRLIYAPDDAIRLDRGAAAGLEPGQHLVVRRQFRLGLTEGLHGAPATGEYTAALIQVVEVEAEQAIAAVVYACTEIRSGDYASAFEPTPMWETQPRGVPDLEQTARVIFGEEGQSLGSPRRYMVIDRGGVHGAVPGQRVTLLRPPHRWRHAAAPPPVLGEGIVVAVAPTSARIWIFSSADAVEAGDLAALHRVPTVVSPERLASAR